MTHKMAAAEAPPPAAAKPHKAEEVQKESKPEDLRKSGPEAKMKELGSTVPNQR